MNASTFATFAVVYLAIASLTLAAPVACGFYILCFGVSAFKAFTSSVTATPVRRSPFGYARA